MLVNASLIRSEPSGFHILWRFGLVSNRRFEGPLPTHSEKIQRDSIFRKSVADQYFLHPHRATIGINGRTFGGESFIRPAHENVVLLLTPDVAAILLHHGVRFLPSRQQMDPVGGGIHRMPRNPIREACMFSIRPLHGCAGIVATHLPIPFNDRVAVEPRFNLRFQSFTIFKFSMSVSVSKAGGVTSGSSPAARTASHARSAVIIFADRSRCGADP